MADAQPTNQEAPAGDEEATKAKSRWRGLRFWRRSGSERREKPSDASSVGCGGFLRRRRRRNESPAPAPVDNGQVDKDVDKKVDNEADKDVDKKVDNEADKEVEEKVEKKVNNEVNTGVEIPFDDVELPPSSGSSEHSIVDEVVAVKISEPQSAWTRPPMKKEAAVVKPKVSLAKLANRESSQQEAKNSSQSGDGANDSARETKNSSQSGGGANDSAPEAKNSSQSEEAASADSEAERLRSEAESRQQEAAEQRMQRSFVEMRSLKAKNGVKIELGPQTEMWQNIVCKSMVGTGTCSRAAACSSSSGSLLACSPAEFAPTTSQILWLVQNFDDVDAFAAAGFGVADTVFLVEKAACTDGFLAGVNAEGTEGLLVARSNALLLLAAFRSSRDAAVRLLRDLRSMLTAQGM